MIVTYSPDAGETQTWSYKAEDLPSLDAEDIEEALNVTFDEFQAKLTAGATKARRALLWVLLRRDNATLKFDDVSFKLKELVVTFDSEELDRIREVLKADKTLDEETKAQALALLDDKKGPKKAPKGR